MNGSPQLTAVDLSPPKVELFSVYPDVREPEPASRDVRGSLPSRAVQRCPPVTTASAFGWYIYPPADFALRWDGRTTEWSLLEDNEPVQWRSLAGGYDGALPWAKDLLAKAPERLRDDLDVFDKFGGTVGFIDADPRAVNTLEVLTGIVARTSPGWWLLVREVPNWPRSNDHQILEGILETDWYRSWLPTMIRLTEQHRVVRFYRNFPIMVAQPIPRVAVEAMREPIVVRRGLDEFDDQLWREFVRWRRRRQDPQTSTVYAAEQRAQARQHRAPPPR